MEFTEILELIVLVAIGIEVYALYSHTKLDHRIDEHILDNTKYLEKTNTLIERLDKHIDKYDEHLIRFEERMNKIDKDISRLDEHIIRINALTERSLLEVEKNNIEKSEEK